MASRNAISFWDGGPSGAVGDSIVRMVPRNSLTEAGRCAMWQAREAHVQYLILGAPTFAVLRVRAVASIGRLGT